MKRQGIFSLRSSWITIASITVLATIGGWLWHLHSVRSAALIVATDLGSAIQSRDTSEIHRLVMPVPFLADKTPEEQAHLTLDLLNDEISTEGIAVLSRDGQFGKLREIFPVEAAAWTQPYAVSPDDCVAFRLKRGELTAELVLLQQNDGSYRILRCNDIRQLAEQSPPSQP